MYFIRLANKAVTCSALDGSQPYYWELAPGDSTHHCATVLLGLLSYINHRFCRSQLTGPSIAEVHSPEQILPQSTFFLAVFGSALYCGFLS